MFDDIKSAQALGYAKAFDVNGLCIDDFDEAFSDLYKMFQDNVPHSIENSGLYDVLCGEFAVHLNFLSFIRAQALLADPHANQELIDSEIYIPEDREIADSDASRFDASS